MEKNTQLFIGVAAIGAAIYLCYKKSQPAVAKDTTMVDTTTAPAPAPKASMVGANGGLKGLKMKKKLVGFAAADNLVARGSKFNAGGAASMPQKTFYDTQSSGWVR
jgi:hypothetical protein